MDSTGHPNHRCRKRRLFGNGCLVIGGSCLAFAGFLCLDINRISAGPHGGMGTGLAILLLLAVLAIGIPVTMIGLYFAIPQWRVRRLPEQVDGDAVEPSTGTPTSAHSETAAAMRAGSPPFGIQHLLGWMLCTALYAFSRNSLIAASGLPSVELNVIFRVLNNATGGLALGALILAGSRWLRGFPFPRYPGEIYLCLLSLRGVLFALLYPLAVRFGFAVPFEGFFFLCLAALAFVAEDSVRVRRWSVFFFSVVAWCIFLALSSVVGFGWEIVVEGCLFAGVLLVSAIDARQKAPYPWTHWLGAVLAGSLFVTHLVGLLTFKPY